MSENRDLEAMSPTKKKILEASMKLFSELGYKSASVRKIAAEVGIRESALYNHFKNKEEIFLSIAADIFSTPFHKEESPALSAAQLSNPKAYLHKFTMEFKLLTFDKTKEALFRLLMIELFQNKELREGFIEEFHNKNIKALSGVFFTLMQEGLVRSSDPMLMAHEFLAPLFYLRLHVALLKTDSLQTTTLSTQFEKHVDFFWDSVKI
jgi:AcrR family transcriptional regulator